MEGMVLLTCLGIVLARTIDVSLGTLRTVFVVQGRRGLAWSPMPSGMSPATRWGSPGSAGWHLAIKSSVCLPRKAARIATQLRSEGFRAVIFSGQDENGPIEMLFLEIPRKKTSDVTLFIREIDPDCCYTIDDVQMVSRPDLLLHRPTGWRAVMKKK